MSTIIGTQGLNISDFMSSLTFHILLAIAAILWLSTVDVLTEGLEWKLRAAPGKVCNTRCLFVHMSIPTASSTSTDSTRFSFLGEVKQDIYLNNIIRRAGDSTQACLKSGEKLIEVSFPENRKSDLSVSESLNTNRAFAKEFARKFSNYGKGLWVLFPDNKELNLAAKLWGTANIFTLTSIDGAAAAISDGIKQLPTLMIVINPGFNVEEWIKLAKINTDASIIIINGSLERLRNGYYPRVFYPELGRVSESYYSRFAQSYCISPVAVGGDCQGAWLCKVYPDDWQLLIRSRSGQFQVKQTYATEPKPSAVWGTAKKLYQAEWGNMF